MQIGDYVTAALVGGINGEPRQGVCIADNGDGTIQVRGEEGSYRCVKDRCSVVSDRNLTSDVLAFVQEIRRQLGLF